MEKKEKSSKKYHKDIEEKKLGLMKSSYDVNYGEHTEGKDIAKRLIKEQRGKLSSEERIRTQEERIKSHSIPSRFIKAITTLKQPKKPSKPVLEKFGVGKLNPTRAVLKGSEGHRLVREVEPKELVRDDRSLYFKESFVKERENTGKWLLS